jgi:hypothetical protein
MATYSKKKLLAAHSSQIGAMANAIANQFQLEGYEVKTDTLMSGGKDISITKGNLFKAVLGMRSALKITLTPKTEGVLFDANVGIFGQQAIPTVISMFFFWPVLLTQIWGLVKQSSLDDKALAIAEQTLAGSQPINPLMGGFNFCPECGTKLSGNSKFCSNCGAVL